MSRPKVLVASTSFPCQENSSAGTFVYSFAKAMSSRAELTVLAPSYKGKPLIALSDVDSRVCAFRYAPARYEVLAQGRGGVPAALRNNKCTALLIPLFFAGFIWQAFLKSWRVDFIQANWVFTGFVVCICGLFSRKKIIVTLHGEDARKLGSSFFHRLLFKLVEKRANHIVCVGIDMYQRVFARYGSLQDRLKFISNGVDDVLFEQKTSNKSSGGKLRLLMVGSLIPLKSVDHSLKALVELKKQRQLDIVLTVIGDGHLRTSLMSLSESYGLNDTVRFLGALPQIKVYEQYAKHDVLLICSRSEGRSSVAMEALAAGMVVVGTRVVGVKELLEEAPGARLYNYGDIRALIETLSELATLCDLSKAGKSNREYADTFLSLRWSRTVDNYFQLFEPTT